MKKQRKKLNKRYKLLLYSTFLILIYVELIIFLQNVMFYESLYFNLYYIFFVCILLYSLKLEFYALNNPKVRQLIFITVLITVNPVIKIFDIFDVNFMEIPIFINVCIIIYKIIKGEINE